ncbi:MAG: hypothetical protein GKR89_21905 [Candidatus Latescibacteria bacterium]|nr:hypothetical protein [Candidatus Latescibacterota bacterium]
MRLTILLSCLLALTGSQAAARSEFHLGGPQGNPWQTALSLEGGSQYLVFDASGQQARTVSVGVTPFGAGVDTLIDFSGTSIQPRFIDPLVNLALTDPESPEINIPFPYIGGEGNTTDGCGAAGQHRPIIKKMFDGDVTTAHFRPFTQSPNAPPGIGEGWGRSGGSAAIVNLGAAIPVNRIRFYPRLGQEDDALLIEELQEPKPPVEAFDEVSFAENYLAWYQIRVGDNSVKTFQASPCDRTPGLSWITPSDSRLEVFRDNRESLETVVDLQFPTRSLRYITVRPFPLRTWEIAEFEVYGEGYVEETVYITQILDFGKAVNWGKVRWNGDLPEGTRVEIRTRTGQTPDPSLYFERSLNGDLQPITAEEYENTVVDARLPTVYDVENWSFWSPPYDFNAGLRDSTLEASAWQDGTSLISPSPTRYIQIAVRIFASFVDAPRLDQFSIQFSEEPAAQQVVGEIWPIEVNSFDPTDFTYVVRPVFGRDDLGFDRLEILTHAQVDTPPTVKVDGQDVDTNQFPPQVLSDRIILAFPKLAGQDDNLKQLEVTFTAPVLRFGTEFIGWVFDSGDPDQIKQRIDPGNATFRFSGDILSVQTPVGGSLLVDLNVGPNPFTPNGDGINERLAVSYKLREVTADRPVTLEIYDLAGFLVRQLPPTQARSGEFRFEWDGSAQQGQLVPPGTYIYRLALDAEEGEERKIGFVSVVY